MNNNWYKKEKPLPTMIGMGGGATSLIASSGGLPVYYWYNTLEGASNIERWYGVYISQDVDGISEYVYAAGDTRSEGQGSYDGLVAKYDKEGAIQWQRTFGSAGVETFAGGVMVDVNGNVYTGGYQTANFYALFVKYNSSGTLQFQKEYYFSIGGSDYGGLGAASLNGNKGDLSNIQLYHTGYVTSTKGAYLVKFSSSGLVQWARLLTGEGGGNAEGNGLGADSSDNIIMALHGVTSGQHHLTVAKWNSSGTIQWKRKLVTSSNGQGSGVACDSNDNVYVLGTNHSDTTAIIAKWNSSGTLQWQRKIDGVNGYGGISIDDSDNIYIAGKVSSGSKIYWAKYNTSGTIQLQRTWDSSGSEDIRDMRVDDQGGVVAVIISGWTSTGNDPGLLLKLPGDGSGTGTYGSYTYAVSTLTESANTVTESEFTGTDSALTVNIQNTSFTSATSTLTSTTATIS